MFSEEDGSITITIHDQPEVTVSEDDLEEFFLAYFTDSSDDDEEGERG